MKQEFEKRLRLSPTNKALLQTINKIIEEYKAQGYTLTLRQLYYQLVSRDIIPNKTSEYAKLSSLLTKGRMAGYVDWSAIEDRNRQPYLLSSWDSPEAIIKSAIDSYRRDRQEGQDVYIELWVEKDALSGVLKRITNEYHITLVVNKGYSSTSAMYDAYNRVKEKIVEGKKVVILYLGDHDPSGLDMIRDIRDRTEKFITNCDDVKAMWEEDGDLISYEDLEAKFCNDMDYYETDEFENRPYFMPSRAFAKYYFDEMVEVRPIGLTMKQIQQFSPPPNPAKITDPRAKWYIQQYGAVSWEVDALNPDVLHKLVRKNVEELIDLEMYTDVLEKEEKDIEKLKILSKVKKEKKDK